MEQNSSLFSLSLDTGSKTQLSGAALWARAFAIAGLLLLGVALARAVYTMYLISHYDAGTTFLTAERIGMIAGYLLIFLIPAFALLFVLRFAGKIKIALNTEDSSRLTQSFQNLKIYFRYMSIIIILFVAIIGITWLIQIAREV